MLLNLRFRVLSDYTPDTVVPDHTHITDALERRNGNEAIALTHAISERVQRELIQVARLRGERRG